jgi:hypothetical protein
MRIVKSDAKFGLRDKTKVGCFKTYEPTFDIKDTIEIDIKDVVAYLHDSREMNKHDAEWAMEGLMEYIDDKVKGNGR